jgi:hypothetical protein
MLACISSVILHGEWLCKLGLELRWWLLRLRFDWIHESGSSRIRGQLVSSGHGIIELGSLGGRAMPVPAQAGDDGLAHASIRECHLRGREWGPGSAGRFALMA